MLRQLVNIILRRERSDKRGQILVLFAAILTILLGFSAFVVDLSWIWINQLQVQRAADAGALAGVVFLPGDLTNARGEAFAETKRNGYQNGTGGIVVNPRQDPDNTRRMLVSVSAPVDTFFLGLFGMDTVNVSREARAEYVLPVPMGSPQNYYGVGEFTAIRLATSDFTPRQAPTANFGVSGSWANPDRAYTDNNQAANDDDGDTQGYRNFNFSIPAGEQIGGIEVQIKARSTDGSGCRLGVTLSGNNGSSNTSERFMDLDDNYQTETFGSDTDKWGASWTPASFSNGNFQLRIRDVDGGSSCTNSARTDVDFITVRVAHGIPEAETTIPVNHPDGTALAHQGFWGAVITRGGNRSNGDQFSPANDGGYGSNPEFDAEGYDYTIEIPGSGGQVHLFDPGYCGTGPNGSGGSFGAGDHWIDGAANPVTTQFRLYNMNNTPYNESDDTLLWNSGSTFANQALVDKSGRMGVPQTTSVPDCSGMSWHNQWWPIPAPALAAGKYRLNVNVGSSANGSTNAENGWSIHVTASGATPKVFGGGRMAAYNNLKAGTQTFYLAQIEALHAGKTLEIQLFDPGDVSGDATLRILSPDGGSYNYATFDYTSDSRCAGTSDSCSANNRTTIRTRYGGSNGFDGSVITIEIPLPTSYGSGGLAENGWWKIEYTVGGGNDTTTWQVNIRGNPVRLIVP